MSSSETYKLLIQYDGTRYKGWQRQGSDPTIQGILEKILSKITREKIHVAGSGRTDSGVHALGQAASFKTHSAIAPLRLLHALNFYLPKDIIVRRVTKAASHFHARFSARRKKYRYQIWNDSVRSLVHDRFSVWIVQPLDTHLMTKEAKILIGRHDFRAFQAKGELERNTVRTLMELKIIRKGSLVQIDMTADGFLHHMVRNIAGTLMEAGRGKMPRGSLKRILSSKDRTKAGPTAKACGLTLIKVWY